jgi:hypothetical protein
MFQMAGLMPDISCSRVYDTTQTQCFFLQMTLPADLQHPKELQQLDKLTT